MKQFFKGMVRPKAPLEGPSGKNYRYMVVGVLVTDEPLTFEDLVHKGVHESLVEGVLPGFAEALDAAPKRAPHRRVGDAKMVLLTLGDL